LAEGGIAMRLAVASAVCAWVLIEGKPAGAEGARVPTGAIDRGS
jgi:hypothetical protein